MKQFIPLEDFRKKVHEKSNNLGDKREHLDRADQSKHWENRNSPAREYYDLLEKVAGDLAGKRLLDVGCAEGREVQEFSKLGLKAEGIDIKPEFIEDARKKFSSLDFSVGSAEQLPFEKESFDVVFSIGTLFYTDIEKSIPEFLRVIKENGYGLINFDIQIDDLDKGSVFHQESIEHLEKILASNNGVIKYLGSEEKRIDAEPFKHQHTFHKIIFQKRQTGEK